MPTVIQINISKGGIPKFPVPSARITRFGITGDHQNNEKYHGGPNRALCIFSQELYDELRREGIDLPNGSIGENLTTLGLDLRSLHPGDRLRVGQCLIKITSVRVPCRNLRKWHPRLDQLLKGRSGWMAKVLVEGNGNPGDVIELVNPR